MRVTDMRGVDITTYTFDFDLTFAALLMHADGTVYHTYGGRDWTDPQSHLSVESFVKVLTATLPEHEAYARKPAPPRARKALSVDRMPAMRRRPKQPDCYHCHMVHDAMTDEAQYRKRWKKADVFRWPDPVQVGLRVERDDQAVLAEVVPDSPAARAGLVAGDRLRTLGGRRILALGDVLRVLHDTPAGPARLDVTFEHAGEGRSGVLRLAKGWREATPLVFSWRASKWKLGPRPGFGGPQLSAAQLRRRGLDEDAFAFRVQYIVTWGPNRNTGRNARKAGIRKDDVILAVGGKRDFASVAHFHAWFRLTQKAGATLPVELLRGDERVTIELPVVD